MLWAPGYQYSWLFRYTETNSDSRYTVFQKSKGINLRVEFWQTAVRNLNPNLLCLNIYLTCPVSNFLLSFPIAPRWEKSECWFSLQTYIPSISLYQFLLSSGYEILNSAEVLISSFVCFPTDFYHTMTLMAAYPITRAPLADSRRIILTVKLTGQIQDVFSLVWAWFFFFFSLWSVSVGMCLSGCRLATVVR